VTEHKSNFPEFYITAPQPCPYLPGKLERKLFTHLTREKPGFLIDNLLKGGFRRSQNIAYMPYCDACSACVPVRILVDAFRPRRSLNRIARDNRDVVTARMEPSPSAEQYSLFRAYIDARHGDGGMAEMSVLDYSLMVEDSVVETSVTEYRLRPDQKTGDAPLIGVSLCDRLSDGISMVYSFYDPDLPRSDRVRAEPRAPLRLSRLLDRWLAQDALQEPLPAAGAPDLKGLGAHGRETRSRMPEAGRQWSIGLVSGF
jgi:arginine-tRNA-protein transferase